MSFPQPVLDFLRGDEPGKVAPAQVASWHAEAVKLNSALKAHGLDFVVIPQNEKKAPSVKFVGPRDDCCWPEEHALDEKTLLYRLSEQQPVVSIRCVMLEFGEDPAFDMCDHTLLGGLELLHWTTATPRWQRTRRDDDSEFAYQ